MAYDQDIYAQLQPIVTRLGEAYELVQPPTDRLEIAYKTFMASPDNYVPALYPQPTNPDELNRIAVELRRLRLAVAANPVVPAIGYLYDQKIQESLQLIVLVQSAYAHDDATFASLNHQLYGHPDPTILAAAATWLVQDCQRVRSAHPELQAHSQAVLSYLVRPPSSARQLTPEPELFMKIRQQQIGSNWINRIFGVSYDQIPSVVKRQTGDRLVRRAISNLGSDYQLTALYGGLWSVSHRQHQVTCPADYDLPRPAFVGIVAHEVGSHLAEAVNGAASELRLLGLGLAGYERGNEGRAFLREQIMYETFEDYVRQPGWLPTKPSWQYRLALYLVIAGGLGKLGPVWNFSQAYDFLCNVFTIWLADLNPAASNQLVSRAAWDMTVRALKGTSGQGGAFVKDIVYLEGNIRCWQVAQKHPELIMFGDLGKFDITNNEHVRLLTELGILPDKF